MSGDNHLKHLAHAYASAAKLNTSPFNFKGQNAIPHNPKNNRKTKSKGKNKNDDISDVDFEEVKEEKK